MQVTAIIGRVEIANAAAAILTPLKVASGQTIAQGVPLAGTQINLLAPVSVTQPLLLVTDYTVLSLATGDSLAVLSSVTALTGVGSMTFFLAPSL